MNTPFFFVLPNELVEGDVLSCSFFERAHAFKATLIFHFFQSSKVFRTDNRIDGFAMLCENHASMVRLWSLPE